MSNGVCSQFGNNIHISDVYNDGNAVHQHWFDLPLLNLRANTGDVLVAWVNLDPDNPPDEIMLQWMVTENVGLGAHIWEHRAYWGANNIAWGTDGSTNRFYVGPLPSAGAWVRLEVPAAAVGLEGKIIQGMAFSLHGGRAAWDQAGKFIPDMDGNGLPDSWEIQNFGHIGVDPNGDPDHDGLSNLQEYLAGSDPRSRISIAWLYITIPPVAINLPGSGSASSPNSPPSSSANSMGSV